MYTADSQENKRVDFTASPLQKISEADRLMLVRIMFWTVGILCGLGQTWSTRHEIISDGISYIEIAQAYIRHDWANALNAYWSPLFSWLVALAYSLLRPSPYWQVATVHLVLLLGLLASLFSFEYFMRQLASVIYPDDNPAAQPLSQTTLYITGYSALLFGGLSLVGIGHCSPDMIAFALTFLIMGLLLHISRNAGLNILYVALGAACALFYLDRTAFAPSIAICLLVSVLLVRRQHRPIAKPALLFLATTFILSAPFIIGISVKTKRLTIGESGRLNYGWEVDGADQLVHWQGKPFGIGKPLHPTTQVFDSPKAFIFAEPIAGTYPPWYDPSYWYAGIKPKLKPAALARILLVNITVAVNYLVRSPIFLPACLVILMAGIHLWWASFLKLWPILIPPIFGLALYCFVYFEKRYIAANFVVIWIAVLAAIRLPNTKRKALIQVLLSACALLFLCAFVFRREIHPLKTTLRDLFHHRESGPSVDSLLAERLTQLGLHPGDKIAYIGPGINANWARLAQVKIVAEIPLMYGRNRRMFNNLLIDDTTQIKAFWDSDESTKQRIYRLFRSAGAKMIVTDGFFCSQLSTAWPRVLPENQANIPPFDPSSYSQVSSRYYRLDNLLTN